ncbi:MAG: hypothetical protein P0Y56_13080 [Candidatus Andeanibacterium colombiense]|uniref:DUF6644 domain-containing protein n=1 Tax=Candidatus Andeanibacterium colombiense TaxID=3121345 RepID=A0AAJ6BNT0_9SPHN|nr:MAG: hypothetical protein P0Y56_13080 [Sphingomonadaceae bacterium]
MNLSSFWQGLEASALGDYVAESTWAFPTLESLHVMAFVTVLGSLLVVDLRLLGLGWKDVKLTTLSHETLRITWIAFICAAITGLLLFCSKATSYVINPYFKLKLVMLAFAALNMLVFQFITWKTVADWDLGRVPTAAKVSASLSLLAWVCVVFFGRAIGFTLSMFY